MNGGKYIFVVGGVYSGTGKGIGAASIGLLLRMRGLNVQLIKCDPYLNINAGTMNPRQHGEVFLCDDGSETDLDLGHYERLAGITVSARNIFTSGALYKELIDEEEQGKYLGDTVQIVPHVTNKIQQRLREIGKETDVTIVEIGGTVGDFESGCFYEAVRQFKQTDPENVFIIMVAPVIWNNTVKEFKTKPLQNAVRALQSTGLQPEMLLCRSDRSLPEDILKKVARLTNVSRDAVFEAPDVKTIYQVPIEFYERHVDDLIADRFHLRRTGVKIHKYKDLVERYVNGHNLPEVTIGVVGKYENCDEAYISLKEALVHAAVANNVRLKIKWIDAEQFKLDWADITKHPEMEDVHGIIVPGGFDSRGVQGKIEAIAYCRRNNVPFLGICLGLQCAVIEFAKYELGIGNATSQEFDKINQGTHVIHFVDGQSDKLKKSGTMRLGSYECVLVKDTLAKGLYKKKLISERHRHRYEVNSDFVKQYEEKGFIVSGRNPDSNLVEVMELRGHPFFIGTQAHPEFKSRLGEPAPLFDGLVKAAHDRLNTSKAIAT
jgi:CTP synthase